MELQIINLIQHLYFLAISLFLLHIIPPYERLLSVLIVTHCPTVRPRGKHRALASFPLYTTHKMYTTVNTLTVNTPYRIECSSI